MILSKVNITYTYTSIKRQPYFVPSHIRRAGIDGQTGGKNSLKSSNLKRFCYFCHQQCEKICLRSFITSLKDMNVENDKKYLNADQAPAVEREKTVKM